MENLHLVLGGGKKFDNITSDAEFNNVGKEIIDCIFLLLTWSLKAEFVLFQ